MDNSNNKHILTLNGIEINIKRKRGRPRKYSQFIDTEQLVLDSEPEPEPEPPIKKSRGRPRKYFNSNKDNESISIEDNPQITNSVSSSSSDVSSSSNNVSSSSNNVSNSSSNIVDTSNYIVDSRYRQANLLSRPVFIESPFRTPTDMHNISTKIIENNVY